MEVFNERNDKKKENIEKVDIKICLKKIQFINKIIKK